MIVDTLRRRVEGLEAEQAAKNPPHSLLEALSNGELYDISNVINALLFGGAVSRNCCDFAAPFCVQNLNTGTYP